jgi:hypothetical protein
MHKAHVSLPGCRHAVVVNQHQRFDGRQLTYSHDRIVRVGRQVQVRFNDDRLHGSRRNNLDVIGASVQLCVVGVVDPDVYRWGIGGGVHDANPSRASSQSRGCKNQHQYQYQN